LAACALPAAEQVDERVPKRRDRQGLIVAVLDRYELDRAVGVQDEGVLVRFADHMGDGGLAEHAED
jgi:hypothetical protein